MVAASPAVQRLLEDVPDGEALVLRQRQVPHLVVVDETLAAADDALQEVNGVALEGRQVRVALHGEKHVPTTLVTVKKGTYTSRFDLYLAANIAAVTFWFAFA